MNQKTLKNLRSTIRRLFVSLPIRGLSGPPPSVRMRPDYTLGLNRDGTPKMVPYYVTRPLRNSPATQRAIYRRAKRMPELVAA